MDDSPLIPSGSEPQRKQGHRCCLCCCDTRRATIITTIILLALSVLALIAGSVNLAGHWDSEPAHRSWYIAMVVGGSIGLVVFAIVILGAARYSAKSVILGAFWVLVGLVADITYFALWKQDYWGTYNPDQDSNAAAYMGAGVVVSVLMFYVYGMFVVEVQSGVMSKETQEREKYSCCCGV